MGGCNLRENNTFGLCKKVQSTRRNRVFLPTRRASSPRGTSKLGFCYTISEHEPFFFSKVTGDLSDENYQR